MEPWAAAPNLTPFPDVAVVPLPDRLCCKELCRSILGRKLICPITGKEGVDQVPVWTLLRYWCCDMMWYAVICCDMWHVVYVGDLFFLSWSIRGFYSMHHLFHLVPWDLRWAKRTSLEMDSTQAQDDFLRILIYDIGIYWILLYTSIIIYLYIYIYTMTFPGYLGKSCYIHLYTILISIYIYILMIDGREATIFLFQPLDSVSFLGSCFFRWQ